MAFLPKMVLPTQALLLAALAFLPSGADAMQLQGRIYYGWNWWLWLVIFVPIFLITMGIILCVRACHRVDEDVVYVQQPPAGHVVYGGDGVAYVQQPAGVAVQQQQQVPVQQPVPVQQQQVPV